ncbi:MAG: DUF4058 family protein [Cyanobacteria bacterium J06634_5]
MASPFPGMDPYLEQSAFWSSFHTRLIVAIADTLAPMIRPQYYVEVETRTYTDTPEGDILVGIPDAIVLGDAQAAAEPAQSMASEGRAVALKSLPVPVTLPMPVEVRERYLEIRAVQDDRVITVIEILSPANKRPGRGREAYEAKRLNILGSASHLVEVDLLRDNPPLPINSAHGPFDYYILVSIASQRPKAQLYPFNLRETFPTFLMPLQQPDEAVSVNMQSIFEGVIERASYDSRIDYTQPIPAPNLSIEDQSWAADLMR